MNLINNLRYNVEFFKFFRINFVLSMISIINELLRPNHLYNYFIYISFSFSSFSVTKSGLFMSKKWYLFIYVSYLIIDYLPHIGRLIWILSALCYKTVTPSELYLPFNLHCLIEFSLSQSSREIVGWRTNTICQSMHAVFTRLYSCKQDVI